MLDPLPRLCLDQDWRDTQPPCAAIFCLSPPTQDLIDQAHIADTALIVPFMDGPLPKGVDGLWTPALSQIRDARKRLPQTQLVALATDRHSAMMMGEAGADLILFGALEPPQHGDLSLAKMVGAAI